MVGTSLTRHTIFRQRPAERLQPLLQRRLVIARERLRAAFVQRVFQFAAQERLGRLETAVEIDRGDQRLVGVGEQRLLETATGLFLAAPEDQMFAEPKLLGMPGQRLR
jgi:hypothetical protein